MRVGNSSLIIAHDHTECSCAFKSEGNLSSTIRKSKKPRLRHQRRRDQRKTQNDWMMKKLMKNDDVMNKNAKNANDSIFSKKKRTLLIANLFLCIY